LFNDVQSRFQVMLSRAPALPAQGVKSRKTQPMPKVNWQALSFITQFALQHGNFQASANSSQPKQPLALPQFFVGRAHLLF
jgi:hypothetical protein